MWVYCVFSAGKWMGGRRVRVTRLDGDRNCVEAWEAWRGPLFVAKKDIPSPKLNSPPNFVCRFSLIVLAHAWHAFAHHVIGDGATDTCMTLLVGRDLSSAVVRA